MAALELGNCEATSDANADEQLWLAAALRVIAGRLDDVLAARKPCVCWQNGMDPGAHYDSCLLARLDADIPATPPPTPGGTKGR
jgi:hypothetical protein